MSTPSLPQRKSWHVVMTGLAMLLIAQQGLSQPPISDPGMQAPPGSMPGKYPFSVVATNMNVSVFPGSTLGGANSDNLRVQLPAGGPIRWTESRHNEGDIAMLIGPFDPSDPSYYPPDAFVNSYSPLAGGQPFANTTLAWRVNRNVGAAFATVRHNGVNNGDVLGGNPVGMTHGIAYFNRDFGQGWGYRMNDGVFANGGEGSADLQMGVAGNDQGLGEANFNVAAAFLPYSQGWLGAWVAGEFSGPGVFDHGNPNLSPTTVNWNNGIAHVALPGVHSATDGMLFVAPSDGNNSTDIAAGHPVNGGWNVTIREDNDTDFSGGTYNNFLDNPFQFVYVPYNAARLVGGHVNGGNGNLINSAGNYRFNLARTASGQYALSVFERDGVTRVSENEGMLMLSVAGALPGDPNLGDRKFLSYEYDANSGNFIIQARELVATNSPNTQNVFGDFLQLRDVDFYFAFVDFRAPFRLGLPCDFNNDNQCNLQDIDLLTLELSSGGSNLAFDLNGDGNVTAADLNLWLADAGDKNLGPGRTYRSGDANLDSVVDGSDFGIWNANKFTATGRWSQGDFNADGVSDGSDFGVWNANKFTSADGSAGTVPEPAGGIALGLFSAILLIRRSRLAVFC